MPSREEIAAWLREAAPYTDEKFEAILLRSAAQVEAMRCGECKHYVEYFEQVTNYNRMTNRCLEGYVMDQGKDFGCFHHEEKDANHK